MTTKVRDERDEDALLRTVTEGPDVRVTHRTRVEVRSKLAHLRPRAMVVIDNEGGGVAYLRVSIEHASPMTRDESADLARLIAAAWAAWDGRES